MIAVRFPAALATAFVALIASAALLTGCKSSEAARAPSEERTTPLAPGQEVLAPADSPFAQVRAEMSPAQVQGLLGSPSAESIYPTSRTFNPYGTQNDSGNRVEYKYKGQGRVVFAVPKYGGNMKVVRVDYDPAEDGN